MHSDMVGFSCIDCVMLIANGELPPEMNEEEAEDFLHTVTTAEGPNHILVLGDTEVDFSWRPCSTCGSPLGGTRIEVHWLAH